MTTFQLKEKYLQFFEKHQHVRISGASLVPENDPTVLFTTAGMHPLVPYIMGQDHPAGNRLVNCQRCVRTGDIAEVGDFSHLTFFEMLGNWSFGSYFKEKAIEMSFEFLTSSDYLNIPVDRLSVSVYQGDDEVPADEESAKTWEKLGIKRNRIFFLDKKNNWWGPAGLTGPCGPDTEMFYDTAPEKGEVNTLEQDRHLEIWNDVFMQYEKTTEGKIVPLTRRCVDTGMGLERTATILQNKKSVFDIELFTSLIKTICSITHTTYVGTDIENKTDRAIRIIADHVRTAVFMLGDEKNILPSNMGQGYILRRIIRRAMRFGRKLGVEGVFLSEPAQAVLDTYIHEYPILDKAKDVILKELVNEEHAFLHTLRRGEKEFEKLIQTCKKQGSTALSGTEVFHLYDTYGFPMEITKELAHEQGFTIDEAGFTTSFAKHQKISKQSFSQTFKGGLSDHGDKTTKLHTATHLLHQALRQVLGLHVSQKGSNITSERLRFDFVHQEKMSAEQITEVETIVNKQIDASLNVTMDIMRLDHAKTEGALAFFADKYDEKVQVYSIGNFSKEVCGGPHVKNTKSLGVFKIQKEQSSSRGVRRIKAVLQ